MTEDVNMLTWEGNSSLDDFLKKCDEKIQTWGKAVVYYFATGCGLDSYAISKRRLQKFARIKTEFVFVEDRKALKRGSCFAKLMALKKTVTNAQIIKEDFTMLMDRKYKLRASCGCSIFLSDAQEVKISVLNPACSLSIEY